MANLNLNKGTTAVLAVSFFKGTTANSLMLKERNTLGAARKVMDAARMANGSYQLLYTDDAIRVSVVCA